MVGRTLIIAYILFTQLLSCSSQGEFLNWYFGHKCGISFASGMPVFLNGNPNTLAASLAEASVSDSSGNLLFFSNGIKIWNRNKVVMPNGSGLLGGEGACQVMAVQHVGNPALYYLFTVHHRPFVGEPLIGAYYSIIDMQLDGGKGDVVPGLKNIPLPLCDTAYAEVSATRHQNNRFAWVVFLEHGIEMNYLAFLVDSSGLNTNPVVSPSTLKNSVWPTGSNERPNFMRISQNGKFLFCTDSLTEMCLFNAATGEVHPQFRFWPGPGNKQAESQEFSIDSRYIYFTTGGIPPYSPWRPVVQYDMANPDSSGFMQSQVVIGDSCGGGIQMAPDGKIYLCSDWANHPLHRINNPSAPGIGCNYEKNAFDLKGNSHYFCLPQFLERYKSYLHHSSPLCQNDSVHFSNDIWPPPDSIHWDFGDPSAGSANFSNLLTPAHRFSAPGDYTVEMWVRHIDKRTDTTWAVIHVFPSPIPVLGNDTTLCLGDSLLLDAGFCTGCTYSWTDLTSGLVVGTSQTYLTKVAGIFEVAVTDTSGCTGRDTVQVGYSPPPVVTNSPLNKTICTGDSTNIILTSSPPASLFYWTATLASGNITGFSADSGLVINQVLVNHDPSPGVVTYHITPKVGGCIGTASDFNVTVNPADTVKVSISASANNVCAGTLVTFTSTPVNGGTNPFYQWKVNGNNVGTSSPVYSYIPANGDSIRCILTSSQTCTSGNPASSNKYLMVVNPNLPVSVTVSASANPVCTGTNVTFTATPVNGGTTPIFLWKVNGVNVGTNNPVYSYIPSNGDSIRCVLTSSEICTIKNPVSSINYLIVVNPILPVSVTVAPSSNPFCPGNPVTFTATPVNGGTTPAYQWKVNGITVGTNSPVYTYNPVNGDLVWCILTSSELCTTGNPATSNQHLMIENTSIPAGVSITANLNPFCPGTTVTFTATPVNGGTSPAYQWKVNGVNAGGNSPVFSFSPQPGDSIRCIMTSNLSCVSSNPASSNKIIMVSNPVPVVTFTRCFDSIITLNAKPIKLKGGIPLGGTYSGPGVNSVTGIFTPSIAGTGSKSLTYSYTNFLFCSASKTTTIIVQSAPSFTCGNNLTDIRDGKIYPTVQIGSQCWMAADLNYGKEISASIFQRDNCLPEKYKLAVSSQQSAYYQWDEVMQYAETPGSQGLCPPAWHIPTEAEWNTLFSNWTNNAFAGMALKYSGYSGFNALLSGVRHMTVEWNWQDVATFYWSSTPHTATKAWSHGMNDYDPGVSAYPALRSNAFSIRCLRD